jgi:hypothetical protein
MGYAGEARMCSMGSVCTAIVLVADFVTLNTPAPPARPPPQASFLLQLGLGQRLQALIKVNMQGGRHLRERSELPPSPVTLQYNTARCVTSVQDMFLCMCHDHMCSSSGVRSTSEPPASLPQQVHMCVDVMWPCVCLYLQKATPEQVEGLMAGFRRLTDQGEQGMGHTYQVGRWSHQSKTSHTYRV